MVGGWLGIISDDDDDEDEDAFSPHLMALFTTWQGLSGARPPSWRSWHFRRTWGRNPATAGFLIDVTTGQGLEGFE